MKTAFICISFIFIAHIEGSRAANYDEFQPRPIPINEWDSDRSEEKTGSAGSLHEAILLGAPKTVAVVPAHYWEDALRHSVYLTLVRDKIDQLIAQGLVVAPDSKPDIHTSKDVDDHNLWEKIKTAPFDRLSPEEPPMVYGDITILAKGRLLEENHGYRFTQDEMSKEKCKDDTCMDGIKAYWSVKRVRQRDTEINQGKYHYELTFSVMSHNQKKQKKPYENPVRTFTVRENNPVDEPKPPVTVTESPKFIPRAQRAIWYHKNINPQFNYHSRKAYQPPSLDRLFFSIFSDEEPDLPYQPRYKPPHQPPLIQQPKVGHVGQVEHQKKIGPYRYSKPYNVRYSNRPPPGPINFPHSPPLQQPPIDHDLTEFDKFTLNGLPGVKQPTRIKQLSEFDTKYTQSPDHKPFSEFDTQFTQQTEQKQTSDIVNKYTAKPDTTLPSESSVIDVVQEDQKPTSEPENKYTVQTGPQHTTKYTNKYTHQTDQKLSHDHEKSTQQSDHKYTNEFDKRYTLPTDHKQFSEFNTKYSRQPEIKYITPNVMKSTKPMMPPKSPVQYPYINVTMPTIHRLNLSEPTTREPEIITYNMKTKPKYPMTKISHFPDHIRPPVFNAPPGVFVTMDKKPFKPMPPLKLPFLSKHIVKKPIDFRPSPQVLDVQFSDPDPLSDSFRPITMNYADGNTTEFSDLTAQDGNRTKTKPKKKHENIKSHRTTTPGPEIITAQNSLSMEKMSLESMNWASNILGTYSKTTPMLAEILEEINDTTTTEPSTTTSTTDASWLLTTESRPAATASTTTTTTVATPKSKKRTRPPAKFGPGKSPHSKVRKHKRVTTTTAAITTTSTTPTTTTTTVIPLPQRTIPDIFSQTTKIQNEESENEPITTTSPSSKTSTKVTTTTSTTTTSTTTTPRPVTSRTTTTPTTTTTVPTTTQQKRNNRFRQSTLIYKGTSVKHDKWTSSSNSNIDKSKTVIPLSKTQQTRRKASNFHGYVSSTPKTVEEERNKDDHVDHFPDSYYNEIASMSIKPLTDRTSSNVETLPHDDAQPQYNDVREQEASNDAIQESIDNNEYIFSVSNTNLNENELSDPELVTVTEISVTDSPLSSSKNKTKCNKKKKTNTTSTESTSRIDSEVLDNVTDAPAVSDIFDEIFGTTAETSDSYNSSMELVGEDSIHNDNYYTGQGDLEHFLKSLTTGGEVKPIIYQEDDDTDIVMGRTEKQETTTDSDESEEDYSNESEESRLSRHPDVPEEPREQPYSFLELLAMD